MNWDAVGALAELVGAVGVIVSLFYVASQIRRNSGALEASTNQAVADATQHRLLIPAQSPELASAFAKGISDASSLSPGERVQLDFFARATFRGIQNAFFQHRKGYISDEVWRDYETVLRSGARSSHMQEWWSAERRSFDEAFVRHYEHLVAKPPAV
jgi:hypothetical protein